MKQLVKTLPSNFITKECLTKRPLIGFFVRLSKCAGWAQPKNYNSDNYHDEYLLFEAKKGVSFGNQWNSTSGGINGLLNSLENLNADVFVFDTAAELFLWLAEHAKE